MPRKLMLLATALLAMGALIGPSAAHAEEEFVLWTMGESPLEEENADMTFKGQMRFTFGLNTSFIECNVQIEHTLEPKKKHRAREKIHRRSERMHDRRPVHSVHGVGS